MWVVARLAVGMIMAAIVAVLVIMLVAVMVAIVSQEVRIDVQLGVEVEALEVKHFRNGHFTKMHTLLRRTRIHVLDAMRQMVGIVLADQIGFADENLVRKTDLTACFLTLIQLLVAMLGIDQRDDRVEQIKLGDFVIHEESLGNRAWIRDTGGFDHDTFEIQGAGLLLLGQVGQCFAQIFANGAADTTIAHLYDVLFCVGNQNVVIDVFFTEFIFNHGNTLAVRFGENTFEQGRFAAAEETGEDGDRNQAHLCSVVR